MAVRCQPRKSAVRPRGADVSCAAVRLGALLSLTDPRPSCRPTTSTPPNRRSSPRVRTRPALSRSKRASRRLDRSASCVPTVTTTDVRCGPGEHQAEELAWIRSRRTERAQIKFDGAETDQPMQFTGPAEDARRWWTAQLRRGLLGAESRRFGTPSPSRSRSRLSGTPSRSRFRPSWRPRNRVLRG